VSEYGSSENAEQLKYIYAYSPYHRVKKGEKYPAVLFATGDEDTRVAPLHAQDGGVLLHDTTKAGHSTGSVVYEMRFLFWQLGMNGK